VHNRREQTDLESGLIVPDRKRNPEQQAIIRERAAVVQNVLACLTKRDREILIRF